MTAPAVASVSSAGVTSTAITSLSVAAPAGLAAGDLLLAMVATDQGRPWTVPVGWSAIGTIAGASGPRLQVMARVVVSGDLPGPFTFTNATGFNQGRICLLRITGASSNLADIGVDAGPGANGNSQTTSPQNITTPVNDCLVIYGAATSAGATSAAGWNEDYDADDANTYHLSAYSKTQSTAGLVSAAPIVLNVFWFWSILGVSIRPGATGGPFPHHLRRRLSAGMQTLGV